MRRQYFRPPYLVHLYFKGVVYLKFKYLDELMRPRCPAQIVEGHGVAQGGGVDRRAAVPNHLNLGNDGKLYLTWSSETEDSKTKPQAISLKESVAWFRLGHSYSLNLTKGESFSEWLKMIEAALVV